VQSVSWRPPQAGRLVKSGLQDMAAYLQARQAYRYRHVSGPVQRQQTKWVALAVGLVMIFLLVGIFIPTLFLGPANPWSVWSLAVLLPLFLLFPASIAIAIPRHQLYDIDRLLSRTLTYGLLTVVLGIVYVGAVVVLGQALNPQGGDSALAVAASTLLVAGLFQPLRRRIQARSTDASTDAATTPPTPSTISATGCANRSTSTRYRPSCWPWSTRRCSRRRRPCGSNLALART
jgi:hypothetical protein